jgi:hypothetical protein
MGNETKCRKYFLGCGNKNNSHRKDMQNDKH